METDNHRSRPSRWSNEALFRAVNEHEYPRQFVVFRNHVLADVERVVSNMDGYVVVEKSAAVSEVTEATDPNA